MSEVTCRKKIMEIWSACKCVITPLTHSVLEDIKMIDSQEYNEPLVLKLATEILYFQTSEKNKPPYENLKAH